MPININSITEAIKRAGPTKVRITPMAGQTIEGKQQIEVSEGGSWSVIADGLSYKMASDLVSQASSRVILG